MFQRRGQHGNPADYFAREMAQYERGFGDPGAEFWLGLDKLATLTRDGGAELMVKLETFEVTNGIKCIFISLPLSPALSQTL